MAGSRCSRTNGATDGICCKRPRAPADKLHRPQSLTRRVRQLPLDLPHEPSFAPEDFLRAPANADALRAIEAWPDWPGRMLAIVGPAGSGKSHLAAIWARRAQAIVIEAEALTQARPIDLARAHAIVIENADRTGSAEANLFHLLN